MGRFSLFLASVIALNFSMSGCSAGFTLRATTEEYKILSKKEPLDKLLLDEDLAADLRRKFELVLDAREFASANGLSPGGSFTEYADIKRDVLVWVLSATPATSLEPYSWWFPVVGRIPYKGFFDLDEAKLEADKLKRGGYDTFLRPSPAFSTLGWFKDPLLSTYIGYDDVNLVATVFHEIFHNTIWIKDDVPFNESVANVVGYLFSEQFFLERGDKQKAIFAKAILEDEMLFAEFLAETTVELKEIFLNPKRSTNEKLFFKEQLLSIKKKEWSGMSARLNTQGYRNLFERPLNNATIVSYEIYLKQPDLFLKLYKQSADLKHFIAELKKIEETTAHSKKGAYLLLNDYLVEVAK